jgi:hypothetical protein
MIVPPFVFRWFAGFRKNRQDDRQLLVVDAEEDITDKLLETNIVVLYKAPLLEPADVARFRKILPAAHLLDPRWHRHSAKRLDDPPAFRGFFHGQPHAYVRSDRGLRFALNVAGKYEDNRWLGPPGPRAEAHPDEWIVTYHGTSARSAASIAKEGYNTTQVWSTSNMREAESYARTRGHHRGAFGERWLVIVQNRVDPRHVKRSGISYCDYYLVERHHIRPYAILLRPMPAVV